MIKFIAEKDGKRLYAFGLSRANMEKLLTGMPIMIDLDIMAANQPSSAMAGAVLIFGGENEQDMADSLQTATGIQPATVIREQGLDAPNIDPRKTREL